MINFKLFKIPSKRMAIVAEMYKNLSPSDRSFYEEKAIKDRQRYHDEASKTTVLKVQKR